MAGEGGLALLENEHSDIAYLFEKVSDPQVNRGKVLQDVVTSLTSHITVEEAVLLPVVTDKGLGGPGTAQQLKADYDEMERLLVLIEQRKVDSPDMPDLVTDLRLRFEDHNELFDERIRPSLGRLTGDEIADLNEKIKSADEVTLSHPHPHPRLSSLGPIARFANRLAARFDRPHHSDGRPESREQ